MTLLAPRQTAAEIRAHGLTLTDFGGFAQRISADELTISEDAACLAGADIILVRAGAVEMASLGAEIAAQVTSAACVVPLASDPECIDVLQPFLPAQDLRAGMVAFQVVAMGQGCFHRETSGEVFIAAGAGDLAQTLATPQLVVREVDNITNLQWGRFLILLNDGLNALSGLALPVQLRDRAWRKLLAAQWREGAAVLKATGITPELGTTTPIGLIPWAMQLPSGLFARVAGPLLDMDAQARTAMAHDLIAGRATQIDQLQGRMVKMGRAAGIATPISARVHELVKLAEVAAEGVPDLPVSALRLPQDPP